MVDLFRNKTKSLPKLKLSLGYKHQSKTPVEPLGSGLDLSMTLQKHDDPYMPHIPKRSNTTSPSSSYSTVSLAQQQHTKRPHRHSMPSRASHSTTQLTSPANEHHYHHYYYYPVIPVSPVSPSAYSNGYYNNSCNTFMSPMSYSSPTVSSPPPLSPTTSHSFSSSARTSWREMKRSPTYQPAPSLSSTDSEDDEPLGLLMTPRIAERPYSLLSEQSEYGDDELVPIAELSLPPGRESHMSAAEKYKAKVKARLQMDSPATINPFL